MAKRRDWRPCPHLAKDEEDVVRCASPGLLPSEGHRQYRGIWWVERAAGEGPAEHQASTRQGLCLGEGYALCPAFQGTEPAEVGRGMRVVASARAIEVANLLESALAKVAAAGKKIALAGGKVLSPSEFRRMVSRRLKRERSVGVPPTPAEAVSEPAAAAAPESRERRFEVDGAAPVHFRAARPERIPRSRGAFHGLLAWLVLAACAVVLGLFLALLSQRLIVGPPAVQTVTLGTKAVATGVPVPSARPSSDLPPVPTPPPDGSYRVKRTDGCEYLVSRGSDGATVFTLLGCPEGTPPAQADKPEPQAPAPTAVPKPQAPALTVVPKPQAPAPTATPKPLAIEPPLRVDKFDATLRLGEQYALPLPVTVGERIEVAIGLRNPSGASAGNDAVLTVRTCDTMAPLEQFKIVNGYFWPFVARCNGLYMLTVDGPSTAGEAVVSVTVSRRAPAGR